MLIAKPLLGRMHGSPPPRVCGGVNEGTRQKCPAASRRRRAHGGREFVGMRGDKPSHFIAVSVLLCGPPGTAGTPSVTPHQRSGRGNPLELGSPQDQQYCSIVNRLINVTD
ncbi:hypothetical protein SKAU_G00086530 [Synaphobranchus kaupii]|uniref:Uncharacterized protein n=1 Tax=Synaphobranchus kaupii TaxID=118154 RepID=A0A9Q1J3U4_SYNKA|nr:hypothetical protein SKAU_G00086530 [Synaphobranchus kaupii]